MKAKLLTISVCLPIAIPEKIKGMKDVNKNIR